MVNSCIYYVCRPRNKEGCRIRYQCFESQVMLPRAKKCEEKNIPPVCEAYGILMNIRWQEFSLIQKINIVLLGVGHTTAWVIFL